MGVGRMSRPFRILLDMDDVIIETNEAFAAYHFRKHGVLFPVGNVNSWSFWPDKSIYIETFHEEDFVDKVRPKKDAIQYIQKWIKEGHDVFIVTACLDLVALEKKMAWVAKNIPEFPLKRLVSLSEKSAMWGDILVDDGPHNILEWKDNGEPIVFHREYNKRLDGFQRVRSFRDIDEIISRKLCLNY
jgi:5'(3')-deoxyribonucleotidase